VPRRSVIESVAYEATHFRPDELAQIRIVDVTTTG